MDCFLARNGTARNEVRGIGEGMESNVELDPHNVWGGSTPMLLKSVCFALTAD